MKNSCLWLDYSSKQFSASSFPFLSSFSPALFDLRAFHWRRMNCHFFIAVHETDKNSFFSLCLFDSISNPLPWQGCLMRLFLSSASSERGNSWWVKTCFFWSLLGLCWDSSRARLDEKGLGHQMDGAELLSFLPAPATGTEATQYWSRSDYMRRFSFAFPKHKCTPAPSAQPRSRSICLSQCFQTYKD